MSSADSTSGPNLLGREPLAAGRRESEAASAGAPTGLDMRQLFEAHYASIWRLLRRLGVRHEQLDDASQEVFWVTARRLDDIRAGSESAFLYGVALRVASDVKRRRKTQPCALGWEQVENLVADQANPEDRLAERRAQEILGFVLDQLPLELRTVFVLFELEGLPLKAIAQLEELPQGTVSSRLRRAREEFSAISRRVRAALANRGGR